MTTITVTSANVVHHFHAAFAAFAGYCTEFRAGAREGREIEASYAQLARKSTPDLNRLGLTRSEIARAALHGTRH
jgi:hypothetical protein